MRWEEKITRIREKGKPGAARLAAMNSCIYIKDLKICHRLYRSLWYSAE